MKIRVDLCRTFEGDELVQAFRLQTTEDGKHHLSEVNIKCDKEGFVDDADWSAALIRAREELRQVEKLPW